MTARNDSPVISTFAHARKLSEASSPLSSIPELPQPRLLHHQQTYIYSPTIRSPKTPKWDRYNTYFYGPSAASQRLCGTKSASTPNVEYSPSILSRPLLAPESDEESDGEDWDQGWDVMSVQEMPWSRCKLPFIRNSDFPYYPQGKCVQVQSRFSDESGSEITESVAEVVDEVEVGKGEKEKKGFRKWCNKVLHKLKLLVRKYR
jgi:hypothetical protein